MQTVTIELLSEKALSLLRQLEQLNILRLLNDDNKPQVQARKWAGSISKETAAQMLRYVEKSRSEWERDI